MSDLPNTENQKRLAALKPHEKPSVINQTLKEKPSANPIQERPKYTSVWTEKFNKLLNELPGFAKSQFIEKHRRWLNGEVLDANQWHPIKEWRDRRDIWQLTSGDYRAFAERISGNHFNFYWVGHKQKALNLLTSIAKLTWYKIASMLN